MAYSGDPRDSRRQRRRLHRPLMVVGFVVALVVTGALFVPGRAVAACASGLFGATGSNGVNGNLYCIDPTTGAPTLVGPITVGPTPVSITGLAFHPTTHVLYVVTGNGNLFGRLVTIDTSTGAATDVGSLGIGSCRIVGDIAFRADGTLFGAGPCGPSASAGNLYTIDLTTGAATFVGGIPILGNGTGFGLTFSPLAATPQKLFLLPERTNQNMYVINPANGAVVQTIP